MTLVHALIALAVIILVTRIAGACFRRLGQPTVIGELVGGILLGPSLLGWVAPGVAAALLPPAVMPLLQVHAQAGVILFMFLVGLELDPRAIRDSGRAAVAISTASVALPFALGWATALLLHPRFAPEGVAFRPFALFLGVALSATAFPVLARILRDRALSRTRLGALALACAAANDVVAWGLLALVISVSQFGDWGLAFARLPGFVAAHWRDYAIFAAFLAGALFAGRARLRPALHDRLAGVVSAVFLPVFFAFSGLRTEIGLVSGAAAWLVCLAIVAVACAGKIGGTVAAARFAGIGWRDAAALGVLMNTRGLVELIVLNVGLDLGILSPTLFAMLVVMALVTTFMTSPLLQVLLRRQVGRVSGWEAGPAGADATV